MDTLSKHTLKKRNRNSIDIIRNYDAYFFASAIDVIDMILFAGCAAAFIPGQIADFSVIGQVFEADLSHRSTFWSVAK